MKRIFWLILLLGMVFRASTQTAHFVAPSLTDPAITTFDDDHVGYINNPTKNKLFVFLPGTGGTPLAYWKILQTAGNLGYHAIGLMYVNGVTMTSYCGFTTDTTCYRNCRYEVLDGIHRHDSVNVDRTNSIENRLIKLLKHLSITYPTEGWDQYLVNDSILTWDKYIMSGHSQGGGHAGFIGKVRQVTRVNMISSADWHITLGRNGDWVTMPGLTPISDYYALIDKYDELIPYNTVELPTWQNFGLLSFGAPVMVDTTSPPYSNTRTLYSTLPPANDTSQHHNAPAVSFYSPADSLGEPLLKPVWEYMIEGAGITSIEQMNHPEFLVYPNPAHHFILVNQPDNYSFNIKLFDMHGREQLSIQNCTGYIELNQPPGIYILKMEASAGDTYRKIVIE